MCTSLCTISWLNSCVVQRITLLKVYIPFLASFSLFSKSSQTHLVALGDVKLFGQADQFLGYAILLETAILIYIIHYFFKARRLFLPASRRFSDCE